MVKAGIPAGVFAGLNAVLIYSGVDEETRHGILGGAGMGMLAFGLETAPVHTVIGLAAAIPGAVLTAPLGNVVADALPVSKESKTVIRETVPMVGATVSAGYGLYKSSQAAAALAKALGSSSGILMAGAGLFVVSSAYKTVTEGVPNAIAAHEDYVARQEAYRVEDDPFGDGEFIPDDEHGGEDDGVTADDAANGDTGASDDSATETVAVN